MSNLEKVSTEASGAAFPIQSPPYQHGLTKREYIAAMALQGMLANTHVIEVHEKDIPARAVKYADALIEALNEEVSQ